MHSVQHHSQVPQTPRRPEATIASVQALRIYISRIPCMYQTSQSMASETCSHGQDPRFLERVTTLPIVTTAIDQLAQIYQYTKTTNPYVKYTLETAEAGVKTVTDKALPVVSKLEKPTHSVCATCCLTVSAIDAIACNQLDKLEQNFPIVTKPTDEVVAETKKVYESTMKPHVDTVSGVTQSAADKVGAAKQYTVETVSAVKDYGVNKVNDVKSYTYEKAAATATYGKDKLDQVLETEGGQAVIARVDQALEKTEQYVDYYLPSDKKGDEPMEVDKDSESSCAVKPSDHTFGKLVNVSDKVRHRMYAKTLKELQHVKKRSQETLERLNFTVDLIEYAKNNLDGAKTKASSTKDKFMQVWEEINQGEEEGLDNGTESEETEITQATLEKRAIATARHLTSQLKRGFHTMMSTVPVLPDSLQKRVNDAKQLTENLYTNFTDAKTLEDISSTLVTQTRTHVQNIRETITNYTEYLRNSYFGSWLGSKVVEEIEGTEDDDEEEEETVEEEQNEKMEEQAETHEEEMKDESKNE